MREIGCQILGEEVLSEAQARLTENDRIRRYEMIFFRIA